MSLKQILINECKQTGFLSIERIEQICKGDNTDGKMFRISNAERRLRRSECDELEAVRRKGIIIGYRPAEANFEPQKQSCGHTPFDDDSIDFLNKQLIYIMSRTKPTWENGEAIKSIQKAIKSPYKDTKKRKIKECGKEGWEKFYSK